MAVRHRWGEEVAGVQKCLRGCGHERVWGYNRNGSYGFDYRKDGRWVEGAKAPRCAPARRPGESHKGPAQPWVTRPRGRHRWRS